MTTDYRSSHEHAVRLARWWLVCSGLGLFVLACALLARDELWWGYCLTLVFVAGVSVIVGLFRPPALVVALMLLFADE